jgi:hypothetical protein
MLSVKVEVGGGGTSWEVNVMDWPLPSSRVRVLSPATHWWVLVGTEVEKMLADDVRGCGVVVLLVVRLGNGYNGGGGTTTRSE